MKQKLTTKQRLWIARVYWIALTLFLLNAVCLCGTELLSTLGIKSAKAFAFMQIVGNSVLAIVLLAILAVLSIVVLVLWLTAKYLDVTLMVWRPDKWRMITRALAPVPIETTLRPEQVEGTLTLEYHAKLRENLAEHFNKDELCTLCFDLGIKHENLAADTIDGMARELVAYCERTGKIPELVAQCRKLRQGFLV